MIDKWFASQRFGRAMLILCNRAGERKMMRMYENIIDILRVWVSIQFVCVVDKNVYTYIKLLFAFQTLRTGRNHVKCVFFRARESEYFSLVVLPGNCELRIGNWRD